jgi:hypothetical protein
VTRSPSWLIRTVGLWRLRASEKTKDSTYYRRVLGHALVGGNGSPNGRRRRARISPMDPRGKLAVSCALTSEMASRSSVRGLTLARPRAGVLEARRGPRVCPSGLRLFGEHACSPGQRSSRICERRPSTDGIQDTIPIAAGHLGSRILGCPLRRRPVCFSDLPDE